MNGNKEVLGLWLAQTEGVKFWPQVVTELFFLALRNISLKWSMPIEIGRLH